MKIGQYDIGHDNALCSKKLRYKSYKDSGSGGDLVACYMLCITCQVKNKLFHFKLLFMKKES